MDKGKDFEKLVAAIEEVVHNLPETKVFHNVKMNTKYGVKRQVDILIVENRGRFEFKTIIECKNTKAKVSVNTIGAFKELRDSVGAHQGIMVSSAGFQKGVFQSVKNENIFLYQLSQIKELKDHLQRFRFSIFEIKHTSEDFTLRFKEVNELDRQLTIYDKLSTNLSNKRTSIVEITEEFLKISEQEITEKIIRCLTNPMDWQRNTGKTNIKIEFTVPFLFEKNGNKTEVTGFEAVLRTDFFTAPTNVKNVSEYKDIVKSINHALVFDVEFGGELFKIIDKNNE